MAKLTFFPLENADTTLIDLDNGEKLLFDYANRRDPEDKNDKCIDLPKALRDDLDARDYYDMVAFTHLDQDHYDGMTNFFYLEHDKKYQGKVDGKARIKMSLMWVPAAVITEEMTEEESIIIQKEAQYRLKNKCGIRVFSLPSRLEDWLKKNGLKLEDIEHLITDAGRCAPEFTIEEHGVEFFIHSPFATRQDDNDLEIRNEDALVVQATFESGGDTTKLLLFADINYDVIRDIVKETKRHKKEERLESDVVKIPHHCSYTAIGPEKGDDRTEPDDAVKWLYEENCQSNVIFVSTSEPIPSKGSDADKDCQPPHRQAANYYKKVAKDKSGQFLVTMEHPTTAAPKPIVIEIDSFKATVKKEHVVGVGSVLASPAPRAG